MPEGEGSADPTKTAASRRQLRGRRLDSALDLVHLTLQCQGDRELERELLGLFRVQSRAFTPNCPTPLARLSLESKATIAHKLRGSALVVGAHRVARAAEALERKARAARGETAQRVILPAIAALEAAIAEVVAEIELGRN
jgi:HPt (histidine-containing phosphotransfer) domain-containing protein